MSIVKRESPVHVVEVKLNGSIQKKIRSTTALIARQRGKSLKIEDYQNSLNSYFLRH